MNLLQPRVFDGPVRPQKICASARKPPGPKPPWPAQPRSGREIMRRTGAIRAGGAGPLELYLIVGAVCDKEQL